MAIWVAAVRHPADKTPIQNRINIHNLSSIWFFWQLFYEYVVELKTLCFSQRTPFFILALFNWVNKMIDSLLSDVPVPRSIDLTKIRSYNLISFYSLRISTNNPQSLTEQLQRWSQLFNNTILVQLLNNVDFLND